VRRTVITFAALALASQVTAVHAAGPGWDYAGPPYCTDGAPACVQEAANSYLVAVANHDGDYARLAPMVKRTRNAGEQTPAEQWYTRDAMADSLDESEDPVNAVHSVDWVIDGDEAIAFYAIDASYEERGPQAAQTWLAERFHVTAGEIDEIEALFFFAPGVGSTQRGWTTGSTNGGQPADERDPTWCTGADRACVLTAAQSYFAAQQTGDHRGARLSDDVRRTLNGRTTATDRTTAEAVTLPASAVTYQTRNVRWYVDERSGDAVVFAALDQSATSVLEPGTGHAATLHLAQRTRVTRGLVHEIEQIAWPTPGGAPTPTGWE
jgi:hypothetical protein